MPSVVSGIAIRRMSERDLPDVADIEAGAFTDWYREHRSGDARLPRRTLSELRYASSLDPEGNFVAESAGGALAGFVFSRTWGSVGWFGTLAVRTHLQGSGIGKALVSRVAEHLRLRADAVGLETMPESGTNIGLYARQGFTLSHPTVILELSLIREAERLKGLRAEDIVPWGSADARTRRRFSRDVRDIGDAIFPGLDYTRDLAAVHEHKLGKTLLALSSGGDLEGFAVLRTAPFRELDASGRGYLHILAVRPGANAERVLRDLLRQAWTAATMLGLGRLVTGVSSRYPDAIDLMLRNGFRAVRAAVRMIHRSSSPEIFTESSAVNVSRWAG